MAQGCRGIVSIEADETARHTRQKQAAGFEAMMGIRMLVVSDIQEAEGLARELLS